jgi:CHASE2 domain-containing sensor protein
MRWFDGLAVLVIAGLAAYLAIQPPLRELEGPAYDLLLRARHEIYGGISSGKASRARPSPVVVVALDQETGLRPPFDRLPQELWTPQIAEVMRRTLDAGALVVAQQQAFVASADAAMEGYDADYLAVLAEAAKQGRMVLGRRAPAPDRLGPAPQHAEAVGSDRNVRHIGLDPDPDGVLRHAALYEESRGRAGSVSINPTLALELAARVIGERPHLMNGSDLLLGRHAVPGSEDNAMLMNFQGGNGGIPVFSLGDLYACSQDGEEAFFRKHFDDRVVIFGRTDGPRWRRVTAARFLDVTNTARYAERCRLPLMQSLIAGDHGSAAAGTMPEVLVSATAVRNLLLREGIKNLPGIAVFAIAALLALAAAWAVLRSDPYLVALGVLVVMAGWGYLAVVMLARETWLMPLAQPAAAVAVAFAGAWVYRVARRF